MTGALIYISGPRQLQNELLASFLERETGTRCVADESYLRETVGDDPDSRQRKLILLDCLGREPDACLEALESEHEILSQGDYWVALFNVPRARNLRKRLWKGAYGDFFIRTIRRSACQRGFRRF